MKFMNQKLASRPRSAFTLIELLAGMAILSIMVLMLARFFTESTRAWDAGGEEDLENLIRYQLEPEVYSINSLTILTNGLSERGLKNMPIHLKTDTGMHRLGMEPEQVLAVWNKYKESELFDLRSVFTHLFASEASSKDTMTEEQLTIFEALKNNIRASGGDHILFHALNTGGVTRFPDHQYNMVRLGIGLYGYSPAPNGPALEPTMGLYSAISQIRDVPAGETVGYGGAFVLESDRRVAVIPIGYADGVSRKLGNGRGSVFVKGQRASFLGNICMDMSMVDITHCNCKEGDEVIIFGEKLSIEEFSRDMKTIPYEALTNISAALRVKSSG